MAKMEIKQDAYYQTNSGIVAKVIKEGHTSWQMRSETFDEKEFVVDKAGVCPDTPELTLLKEVWRASIFDAWVDNREALNNSEETDVLYGEECAELTVRHKFYLPDSEVVNTCKTVTLHTKKLGGETKHNLHSYLRIAAVLVRTFVPKFFRSSEYMEVSIDPMGFARVHKKLDRMANLAADKLNDRQEYFEQVDTEHGRPIIRIGGHFLDADHALTSAEQVRQRFLRQSKLSSETFIVNPPSA